MNSHDLHTRGLLDTRAALVVALVADGWPQDEAEALIAQYQAAAIEAGEAAPRKWQRWTPDELALLDAAISGADGRLPGRAVTRPLAERLGRNHKSVLSQIERRIATR